MNQMILQAAVKWAQASGRLRVKNIKDVTWCNHEACHAILDLADSPPEGSLTEKAVCKYLTDMEALIQATYKGAANADK